MSKIKKIATLTFGSGINILVNFLFLPYMARVLSYESYGSYGQTLLIVTFAASLLSFGLPQIIYVYLNNKNNEKEVLSSNLFGATLAGILGVVTLTLSAHLFANWFDNSSLNDLLSIYALSLLFTLPNQSVNSFLIHKNKVKASAVLTVVANLIKVALVIVAIQLYHSVFLALLGILISQGIQLILGIVLIKNHLSIKINRSLLKAQIKKGLPLGLTGILGAGILYIDGIMVSKIEGVEAYAIYRNGAIEVPFISTIYASIAAIILPEVSKLYNNNQLKEIITLKRKVIMNTMMLTYPVLIFLLFNSSELITAYLGEKYRDSSIIFAVFNLTILVRVTNYSDILISANKTKSIFTYYSIAFGFNIIANYVLIYFFGSVGAAAGTVLSIVLLAALQINKSLNLLKANFSALIIWKQFIFLILASLTISTLLYYTLSVVHNRNIKLIISSIIYFPCIYLILLKFNFFSKEIVNSISFKKFYK